MARKSLEQQCVEILRPQDQFMVVQNGQQKLMLVAAFAEALRAIMANHVHLTYVDATAFPATQYPGAYQVTVKATVAGGVLNAHFTDDGTASGNPLFPTGLILPSAIFRAEEGVNPHAFGNATLTNGGKTITVGVNRTGSVLSVLGLSVLGANVQANGSVVYVTAWGR